jgi:hypothetical protein
MHYTKVTIIFNFIEGADVSSAMLVYIDNCTISVALFKQANPNMTYMFRNRKKDWHLSIYTIYKIIDIKLLHNNQACTLYHLHLDWTKC